MRKANLLANVAGVASSNQLSAWFPRYPAVQEANLLGGPSEQRPIVVVVASSNQLSAWFAGHPAV